MPYKITIKNKYLYVVNGKKYEMYYYIRGGIGKVGKLPEWSQERCKLAVEYYFENKNRFDMVFIPTSGGTYHYPNPTDKLGFTIFECDLMTKFLLEHNIPEEKYLEIIVL